MKHKIQIQLIIIIVVFIISQCDQLYGASIYPTERTEDAQFWRKQGEEQLKQILNSINYKKPQQLIARNVIVFIGDGMGMSTITAARILLGQRRMGQAGEHNQLVFETFPNTGLAKTYNVDKQVPDSAGTATALFSGVKTNYGVIGLDATSAYNGTANPSSHIQSFIDWAQRHHKRTGFVTTTRITHATPAALYAHVANRDWECDSKIPSDHHEHVLDIGRQLIEQAPGNRINVVMGGGRKALGHMNGPSGQLQQQPKFDGKFETTCTRSDDRNLADEWLKQKQSERSAFVQNTAQLLAINASETDNLLGLFSDNHMSYSSVRNKGLSGEPSLGEMTRQAIRILNRRSSHHPENFVLMVEGGRIDQAHHQNHARLALEETIEFNDAVQIAMDETNPAETLIIVTADHSHAFTMNGYPVRGMDILGMGNKPDIKPYETLSYANGPGYYQHHQLNQSWIELDEISEAQRKSPVYRHAAMRPLDDETHGGEDVPVYAIGPGSELIRGTFEQNYLAYVISYAACIGPVSHLNDACNHVDIDGDGAPDQLHDDAVQIGRMLFITWILVLSIFCFVI